MNHDNGSSQEKAYAVAVLCIAVNIILSIVSVTYCSSSEQLPAPSCSESPFLANSTIDLPELASEVHDANATEKEDRVTHGVTCDKKDTIYKIFENYFSTTHYSTRGVHDHGNIDSDDTDHPWLAVNGGSGPSLFISTVIATDLLINLSLCVAVNRRKKLHLIPWLWFHGMRILFCIVTICLVVIFHFMDVDDNPGIKHYTDTVVTKPNNHGIEAVKTPGIPITAQRIRYTVHHIDLLILNCVFVWGLFSCNTLLSIFIQHKAACLLF